MGLILKLQPVVGFDEAEVRRAVAILADPEHAIVFSGSPSWHVAVAPGDDAEAMVRAARTLAAEGCRSLYFHLNPVARDHTGKVNVPHVQRRRWLMVDVDPVRPEAYKGDSATDGEKAAAVRVAADVYQHLQSLGWPEPVEVDSGNGVQLLYRIDLPNDAESRELIKAVLASLASEHDDAGGEVGRECFDARRLAALPGTTKRKGDGTDERPHRPVRLLSVPDQIETVTREQLEALAPSKPHQTNGVHPLPVPSPPQTDVMKRAVAYLERIDPAVSGYHGHNPTIWAASCMVRGFGLSEELAFDLLWSHYNPRCVPPWSESELRHKCRQAVTNPIDKPEGWLLNESRPDPRRNGKHAARAAKLAITDEEKARAEAGWVLESDDDRVAEGTDTDMPDVGRLPGGPAVFRVETLARILAHEYPEPRYAVHGLLSEGLNLLAGPPKLGKSMLALNLALTVAGGGKALGDRAVLAGDVLYLSLEDQARRVKARSVKMLDGLTGVVRADAARRLSVVTSWRRQDRGGLAMLDAWVKSKDAPSLIIIDVWNRYSPDTNSRASAYTQDADAMGLVKSLADHHGITVLIVHHTRKSAPGGGRAEDFVAEISGTLGLAGTADGILVMARERNNNQAQLFHTGRDAEEGELIVEFDPVKLVWRSLGTAKEHMAGRVQLAIVNYLKVRGPAGATTPEVAEAISEQQDSVRKALGRMLTAKIVYKKGNVWRLMPDDDEPTPFEGGV